MTNVGKTCQQYKIFVNTEDGEQLFSVMYITVSKDNGLN